MSGDDRKPKRGGDRKSLKYTGSKNGVFITDFFARKDSTSRHLMEEDVKES